MSKSKKKQPDTTSPTVSNSICVAAPAAFLEVNDFPSHSPYLDIDSRLEEMLRIRKELERIRDERPKLTGECYEILAYYMRQRNLSAVALSGRCDISEKTVRKYCKKNGPRPSLYHALALCIGLNLHPDLAFAFLKKAGHNLEDVSLECDFFMYLIRYHHMETLDAWNQRLKAAEFDVRLPSKSAQTSNYADNKK